MTAPERIRNWTYLLGVIALLSSATAAHAAGPLLITSTEADPPTSTLYIYGENFGFVKPTVRFANFTIQPAKILSYGDTVISIIVPFSLLLTPGTYLLSVSVGPAPEQNSALAITVGPQGPKGDTGLPGPKGDTGAQGIKGDTGAQGIKGDIGPVGPQGLQGFTGLKGDKGDKGDIGPVGPQGLTGPQGATGLQGPQGIPGPGTGWVTTNFSVLGSYSPNCTFANRDSVVCNTATSRYCQALGYTTSTGLAEYNSSTASFGCVK